MAIATQNIPLPVSIANGGTGAITAAAARTALGAGTGSGDALVANPISQFAATTSLQLKGVISDETGSNALVFGTSPTITNLLLAAGSATVAPETMTSGTLKTTAGAGDKEYDGNVFYSSPVGSARGVSPSTMYSIVSSSSFNLIAGLGVQSAFEGTGDIWTLAANTSYFFSGHYQITKTVGACTVGMAFALGGGASVTSIKYVAISTNSLIDTVGTATMAIVNQVASTPITLSSTTSSMIFFEGVIRMNAAGTVTPQIDFQGVAPTSPNMGSVSYIKFTPIGSDTQNTVGNVT